MLRLLKHFHSNRLFFILFICWISILSIILFGYHKEDSFIFTNSKHHLFFDYFFSIITYYGDGWFLIICGLLCFFLRSKKIGSAIIFTYIGSGLVCSLLKRLFSHPRPAFFLGDQVEFHKISWISLAYHNAFPSGHTTSAFAFATCIALFSEDKRLAIPALILACLTGYSRVYLGQHFWDDVWFGSIIGLLFSSLYYIFFQYFSSQKWNGKILLPPSFKL